MEQPESDQQIPKHKLALRKQGGIYFLIFIVCLAASLLMYQADIGGILSGLVNLALVVFLFLSIITLIRGYTGIKR
jgi:hypothetical protein